MADTENGNNSGPAVVAPRLIMLVGQIDFETVEKFAEQLVVLNALSRAPITVQITSPGGILDPALAIYDMLMLSPSPIVTCIFGCAGSSASIIALAGARRLIAPNANIMIHSGSLGIEGRFQEKDFDKLRQDASHNNEHVYRIYAKHTGNSMVQIRDWCQAETEMNAQQALKRGFVDGIIGKRARTRKKKAKQRTA